MLSESRKKLEFYAKVEQSRCWIQLFGIVYEIGEVLLHFLFSNFFNLLLAEI